LRCCHGSGSSELEALRVSNGTEDFPFRSVALFYYKWAAPRGQGDPHLVLGG